MSLSIVAENREDGDTGLYVLSNSPFHQVFVATLPPITDNLLLITFTPRCGTRRPVVHFGAMELQAKSTATLCPYCGRPVTQFSGGSECPHCDKLIFGAPCPKCGRRTLNLTQLARYGVVTCFACHSEIRELPELSLPPAPEPVIPDELQPAATVTPRTPKTPSLPSADDARKVLGECLVGLERAAQDREMLRAPDLRAIVTRFLETMQEVFDLDDTLNSGTVTEDWLHMPEHFTRIVRLCYAPLWPHEGALLPAPVQAWVLAVDEAARRWQFARRLWLAESFEFVMMPVVATLTTTNPAWHEIDGDGPVVTAVLSHGFLLRGTVLRRARVKAQ
ncbi:MAG: hypothetical protein ACYDBB_26395 [Armatimonadota bacterium]